ncbi:MAG: hypothetical protein QOI16_604, partial [Pseudonocardiales bacterium]|nr:hypothetical protein [Pseudonocardiales bacterium]
LLITGEAGVGKSGLVKELRDRATTAGMAVCVGRSVEGGGTYRAVTEALAPLIRRDPLLDGPGLRPYRTALSRLLPGDAPADPLPPAPDPAVMLGEGVLALLAGRTSLLVLEDLHWADPDTLDLVRYLAGVLADLPVLLVLTARDDVAQPGVERITAELTTLPLRRLDAAGVAALAAACRAGEPLSESELRDVRDRSDGLPFLVEELLDAGPGRIPASLTALVSRRLAGMPAQARPLVVAAAIVGGDPDWRLVAAMAAEGDGLLGAERTVLSALRAATDVGLLVVDDQRLRWRHALTRDAVLATLLPPERAALAARAAAVLDGRGDRAVAARLHIESGDRARGAAILVELARIDVGRGALRSAAALLGQAGEDTAHAERVLVWTLLGRAVEALETGERALAQVRGAEHAELCLRLAHAAIVAGRWGEARRFVERAARPDDPRSLTLIANAAYGAGDVAEAERLSRAAVQAAAGDPAMVCEALLVLGRSTFATDPAGSEAAGRRAAQIAAEHGLVPWRVQALFGLGSQEHTKGDPDPPSLAAARELAMEAGLFVYVVQADLLRANGILLVDGPAAALPLLRDTAERAGRLRLTGLQAMAELFAAADAGLSVEERAMEGWLAAAVSRVDAPVEVTTLGPLVRALPQLVRHDLARAAALLDDAVPAFLEHGSAIPVDHIGLWALVRTAVADRDGAARETLRGHKALLALGNRAALAYADAIAAGRAGRPDAAALFAGADAMIAHLPWWNRLLRLLALEAAVVDGWGDPVPALRADLAAHEDLGAAHLARTCRDLLRAAGAPTRRRGGTPVAPELRARGVTAREAEVLALVVTGLTNAETAERLFLSPRTVETHVARLLVKTGSADRTELRRWSSG